MEITLGSGKFFVCSVVRDGESGILFRKTDQPHEIDTIDPDWVDGKPYKPTEDDVIVWLGNLAGARVLQYRVNIECLKLNGFDVSDSI